MDFNEELNKRNATYRLDEGMHEITGTYEEQRVVARGTTSADALKAYDAILAERKHTVRDARTILAGRGDIANNRSDGECFEEMNLSYLDYGRE